MRFHKGSCFSPRNGEVILKEVLRVATGGISEFQSPQWGSNSKATEELLKVIVILLGFQSPQWGSNSKGTRSIKHQMLA